jgi:hypothetical protein
VTRSLLGVVLALGGLVPLGGGALLLARTRFRLGLAAFTGMAAAMVALPPLYYVGLSPTAPVVLLVGAIVLVAALLVRRELPPPERDGGRVEVGPLAVLVAPLALLAARGVQKPVDGYDAFADWSLKAKLLYAGRGFGDASIAPPVHREYPLGLPALEAYFFHAMGSADVRVADVVLVLFLAGLALVAWKVLRPHVGAWPLTAGLSLVLWMPAARDQALSAYADVPLACLFISAVLLIGSGRIALGTVFAAAALATKRDAVAFLAVLYVVAFVALLVRREPERVRPLLFSAWFVILSAVPWRIYDHAHGLHESDVSASFPHAGDVPFALGRFGHLFVSRSYLWAVPLAVAACLVMLARDRDRPLALGTLALGVGLVAALAVVYAAGTTGVRYLVRSTAARTLITPTLLAAVLLPLLVARALEPGPRSRDEGDPSGP